MDDLIRRAAKDLVAAGNVAALTGAGISIESGIPPFRGKGGLWERFDPMEFAHIDALMRDPTKVWKVLVKEMKEIVDRAEPNDGHKGLAKLEARDKLKTIITQNVDGLHQAAGSIDVIEYHGTFAWQRCMDCSKKYENRKVDVSEIPPRCDCGGMHILGYLMRLDDASLGKAVKVVQEARAKRNLQMVRKLQELGFDVSYDEILEASGGGQVGRPHVAQVLVQKRIVQSIHEAFAKLLRKGRPAYVERYRLLPEEAIQTILQAGGIPVLAHPFTLNAKTEGDLDRIVAGLKQVGLKGLEAYYEGHGPERTAQYERVARRHGLLLTGGSDFHGAVKPGVKIGFGSGNLRVPYRLVEELKQTASSGTNGK